MSTRLKIKLKEEGDFLKFQVLEMDESFRNKGCLFEASNEVKISSYDHPALYRDEICLRGNMREEDNLIDECSKRKITKEKIEEALNEWREHDYQIEN